MKIIPVLLFLLPFAALSQRVRQEHDHHAPETDNIHNHLDHIQAYRRETAFVHNLPAPQLLEGIGQSGLKIVTRSPKTQQFFSQGVALLHDFWDFEAYRAFKEAIRHDSTAIMPYWGLYSAVGATEGDDFLSDKKLALRKLKALKDSADEHEKLYAEAVLARDSQGEDGKGDYQRKLEQIIDKYPADTDAKLFLALNKMSGYDPDMIPREGQIYSEYLLKDILKTQPDNAAAHHYWIHLKENCCPEQALASAEVVAKLTPGAAHMVHMPGHIHYKMGNYNKAHEAFVAAVRVDSIYMKKQGIPEVDTWNYIHNINYLLSNCAENGRYSTALYYAEKLQKMPVTRERKSKYEGRFFYQGVIAPAKMELCFGFYKKAADRLKSIPADSIFTEKAYAYKEGLYLFAQGMDAVRSGRVAEAKHFSDALDAHLYRNINQSGKDGVINARRLADLNVASVELQGVIESAEGKYAEAVALLKTAWEKEHDLGYSEPPSYARPVLISLAETHLKAAKTEEAIATYEQLLNKHPNSANGLWGLYKAYKQKGDGSKAAEYAQKLKELTAHGNRELFPL